MLRRQENFLGQTRVNEFRQGKDKKMGFEHAKFMFDLDERQSTLRRQKEVIRLHLIGKHEGTPLRLLYYILS